MRRVLAITLPFLIAVTACGDAGSATPETTTAGVTSDPVTSSTSPDKPAVSLPAQLPTDLVVTDLTEGKGAPAATGDLIVLHYVGVRSADGVEFDNSYDRGSPFQFTIGNGDVIAGWEQGLVGVKAGGRRQLDIPAALAYGDQGKGDVIRGGDALSFVVDVIAVLPLTDAADSPVISLSPAANIPEMVAKDLIVGTGATPKDGDVFAVNLVLYRADTGELLNTTWGTPTLTFDFGANSNTFPGITGMADGMKVGGRRQAQIPFATVFDGQGSTQLNLPAQIDVVIVMDLVAIY